MAIRKLRSGSFTPVVGGDETADVSVGKLKKRARLVYVGGFESMDGHVDITEEIIRKIVEVHNAKLAKFQGEPPMSECAPVQVDHSVSGWDTVGRLTGPLEAANDEIDGKTVLGLFGVATILGPDNCERCRDGRWTNLSIGADIDPSSPTFGELKELTIVPFGAAPRAAFLAAGDPTVEREKLKKHLMAHSKLADGEADEKLKKMSDEDVKKELSRFKDDGEKYGQLAESLDPEGARAGAAPTGPAQMSADNKSKLAKLAASATTALGGVQLAAVKNEIKNRFSHLKAATKITPAEIKKLDVEKIARMSKGERDAMFASYDNREPVIPVGQVGSIKAVDGATLSKETRVARLEAETRSRFTSLGKASIDAAKKRLGEGGPPEGTPPNFKPGSDPNKPAGEGSELSAEEVTGHLATINKHMEAGNHEEAMKHLKHLTALWGAHCAEGMPPASGKDEAELAAMSEQVAHLSSALNEMHMLVTSLT